MVIGRILVAEFKDQESSVFDAVMDLLKHHASFEILQPGEEAMVSIPGLESIQTAERYTVADARLT